MTSLKSSMMRRDVLMGTAAAALAAIQLRGGVANAASGAPDPRPWIGIDEAVRGISKQRKLNETEQQALDVSAAFMKAWENPDARVIAGFFSTPCAIKYGSWPQALNFEKADDVVAQIAKTVTGDRHWQAQIYDSWVRGPVVVHDMAFRITGPAGPPEIHPNIYITYVRDKKIVQWMDYQVA